MTKKHMRWGWVFVSPYIFNLVVFTGLALVVAIYYAFTRYDLINPPEWIGLQNFARLIKQKGVWQAFRNVWVYAILSIAVGTPTCLFFAVLLNQKIKCLSAFRVIYYIPGLTPTTATTLVWARLFNPKGGVFNKILGFVGLGPFMFNFSTNWFEFIVSVIIMGLWAGIGSGTIYYIAGLQSISKDLMEAADIDGAGRARKFFKITLPLLSPTIFFCLIINVSSALQVFEQFYLLQEDTGVEIHVVNSLIYSYMWGSNSNVGEAAALGWMSFIFIALVTWLQKKYEKKWVYYEG